VKRIEASKFVKFVKKDLRIPIAVKTTVRRKTTPLIASTKFGRFKDKPTDTIDEEES
jgi:hypothetical protein